MSVFNIGLNDITDQERAMKDKLASKDAHIAALMSQLSKQDEAMQELKETYNENLRKLAGQSTRVVELENDLKARATLLLNEKTAYQNIDTALAAANATIKQRDLEIRDLESKLDQLSHLSDEHKSRADKLAKDKTSLEVRVNELHVTLSQSVNLPPTTLGRPRAGRSRSRSASPARGKILALEQQLQELRSIVQQKENEVQLANEKASRAHDEQIRVGNEKTALERRTTRELKELRDALEEKEDEMRGYTMATEEVAARETELLDRIDEDEARYQASLKLLRDDLAKSQAKVKNMELRVCQAEDRQIQLVSEKEKALDELEKVSQRPAATPTHIEDQAAQSMETLMSIVQRVRSERDTVIVERDSLQARLDFLQAESKFELEALNAKLATGSIATPDGSVEEMTKLRTEVGHLSARHHTIVMRTNSEIRRLGLATLASAVVIQHLDSEAATLALHALNTSSSHAEAQVQLSKSQSELSNLNHKLQQVELDMALNVDSMKENSHEIGELRVQLDAKAVELEQALSETKAAHDAQEFYRKQYDNAESQRSSLALEVTNLNNELAAAKEDHKAAEGRYIELQLHQFEAMSKTDGMRMLQNELVDERARVKRRDEHLKMLQHDIGRMETTLVLQEDRLGEMTTELEAMTAAKDAMVDDCADAREARDRALSRLEQIEVAMEMRTDEADRMIESLVKVVFETAGSAREGLRMERERTHLVEQALTSLEEQHQDVLAMTRTAVVGSAMMEEVVEETRQATVALAVSQLGFGQALDHIRTLENAPVQQDITMERGDRGQDAMAHDSLAQQLETLRGEAADAALDFSNRTAELERQIQNLQQTICENKAGYEAATEELARSKEQLAISLEETQRALSESISDEDISRMREQSASQLAEARSQLSKSEATLDDLRAEHAITREELQRALEDAKHAKEDLELGVTKSLQDVATHQDVATKRQEEILRLEDELTEARSHREAAEVALKELQDLFDRLTTELDMVKAQHEDSLAQNKEHFAIGDLEIKLADLQSQLAERSRELEDAKEESAKLALRLEDEVNSRKLDKDLHQKALDVAQSQWRTAESDLEHLREEIKSAQADMQQSKQQNDRLQKEKLSLQTDITALEAEVQKSISLKRYLESQVKESEDKVALHIGELEQLRENLARSEKATHAAEVNLSLQGAQHKREMADLNRRLNALQSQPDLQNALAELEERNDEMEELLKKKCVEIEENDDRALEMLKENKKLTTKVESLTRKVQTLQTKLAAAKASIPLPVETPQTISTHSQSTVQPSTSRSTFIDRPRSVTVANTPSHSSSNAVSPAPSLPVFLSSTSHVSPPASQTPFHQVVSGSSSLPRAKTPEEIAAPPPVFKARTPERTTTPPPSTETSSSIGKKRRAPDDFEVGQSLPPQAFTADSLPSREYVVPMATTTPRTRRMLSGLQSGFTPVRKNSRPIVTMPSPKRLMTMRSGTRPSPVIADVTNSPRGQSTKTKRSWLGKIRGASSQATNKPAAEQEAE